MRDQSQSNNTRFPRLISEVFSGHFPASDVNKMNAAALERFVLRLVEHTSVQKSAKTLSRINCKDKPKWWPSDVLIKECDTKDKIKDFRTTLKQLIVNCSNFFKTYNVSWLPNTKSWVNDENCGALRGVKRRGNDVFHSGHAKRRKTLLAKKFSSPHKADVPTESANLDGFDDVLQVRLFQSVIEPPVDYDPKNQQGFLKVFGLGLNNNVIKKEKAVFSRFVKFQNCPHIPISSDTGKLMMKKENYSVPEFVTARKLERVEWYVNKQIPKFSNIKFEITYVPPKYTNIRMYKFPKKQFHQTRGNRLYNNFLLDLCKSLVIVIKNEDLVAKKKLHDSFKINVKVPRLSIKDVKRHLHKKVRVEKEILKINKFGRKIKPLKQC